MGEGASSALRVNDAASAPIGAFDSGFGGLTVLREMASLMPDENTVFVGDSAHFPYGPKSLKDVRARVMRICSHLVDSGCKLIVIACNTATAAGLKDAQREFDVPIIGVVEPGSRAATHVTRTRRVGVIATEGTVRSCAYVNAIHNLDAGVEVMQAATPQLVDIAEAGVCYGAGAGASAGVGTSGAGGAAGEGAHIGDGAWSEGGHACGISDFELAQLRASMAPLREGGIDTLVLGCTHFPLVEDLVRECIGDDVVLVSSARETAREVRGILERQGRLRICGAGGEPDAQRTFLTTADDVDGFKTFAMRVMGPSLASSSPVFSHVGL